MSGQGKDGLAAGRVLPCAARPACQQLTLWPSTGLYWAMGLWGGAHGVGILVDWLKCRVRDDPSSSVASPGQGSRWHCICSPIVFIRASEAMRADSRSPRMLATITHPVEQKACLL